MSRAVIQAPIPLSLYIHIPWCVRKCPYCDFNSHNQPEHLPEKAYIDRLLDECQQQREAIHKRPIQTIFIGGGTPSLFSPAAMQRLLTGLHEHFDLSELTEVTMEANPGTVEQSRFEGFRAAGINRLSIGIQSFQDGFLKSLGRIHNGNDAEKAVHAAKQAGFENINLDLMHGLPQQTIEAAMQDLNMAFALTPTHISWYQLTLEPNTYFHKFPPALPNDDLIFTMQQQGQSLLSKAGFLQYEVSAYAQQSKQCQHNLNYWQFGDYLGIGAGAHSKITDFNHGRINRHWNVKSPKDYLDTSKPTQANAKVITTKELGFEFMMNALRLQQPIANTLFQQRTGLDFDAIDKPKKIAIKAGLLTADDHSLCATPLGQRFLNELLEIFL